MKNLNEILDNNSGVDEKHYFAQIVPFDDLDFYYNEYMAEEDNLWAGGNDDYYPSVNESFRATAVALLQDIEEEEIAKAPRYYYNTASFDCPPTKLIKAVTDLVQTYYPGSILSRQDIIFLINMSDKFMDVFARHGHRLDEDDIICRVLGTVLGKKFKHGWFDTGNDRDPRLYLYYICPEDIPEERLKYIGAVLQGIGTELKLANIKCSKEDFLEDRVDTTRDFYPDTEAYDDITQWVADKYGCSPDEVYLLDDDDNYLDEGYEGALCCEFWL